MGKFDGVLICTDLDGTLYKKDKTVSRENREAIEYFKREGGYFTFITGRMPDYSIDAYQAASPNVPYGCINGGGVYDGEAKRYVWTTSADDGVKELVRFIYEGFPLVGIQVCTFNNTLFARDNDANVWFRRITGVPDITCDYKEVNEPIAKIMFASLDPCELDLIGEALRSHELARNFEFVRSERSLFEILPKGVNKGLALFKLVEYLGVDPKKTVAIGDYDNDIGMLRTAGLGVAVANASPKAKEAADLVTVSNEEHAIAKIIYDLRDGKISF